MNVWFHERSCVQPQALLLSRIYLVWFGTEGTCVFLRRVDLCWQSTKGKQLINLSFLLIGVSFLQMSLLNAKRSSCLVAISFLRLFHQLFVVFISLCDSISHSVIKESNSNAGIFPSPSMVKMDAKKRTIFCAISVSSLISHITCGESSGPTDSPESFLLVVCLQQVFSYSFLYP